MRNVNTPFVSFAIALWLGALLDANSVRAQQFVVDQSATPEGSTFVLLSGGVGQEFVPTFTSLDFVELKLGSMNLNDSGTFQVRIHEDSIAGNIVGVSELLPLELTGGSTVGRGSPDSAIGLFLPGGRREC